MTNYLKNTYLNPTLENIELLIKYFLIIGGKPLSTICRKQNAFKTKWIKQEENLRSRCHIQSTVEYLESIKSQFTTEQIKTVLADISKYVNVLDPNEDTSFILISTNTLPSAIHFDTAKKLFSTHQISDQHQNNYALDILTIYSLRLSLESRIRGLLGIDFATNNGKPIGLNILIKVSKNLKLVSYSNSLNWKEIEWINDWINHHMHRLIRPYPWIIFLALESLQPFVDPKEPVKTDKRVRYSFYSAALVENEQDFHQEIENSLKKELPNIEINWKSKKEIMLK
jgi:hypothetical protein